MTASTSLLEVLQCGNSVPGSSTEEFGHSIHLVSHDAWVVRSNSQYAALGDCAGWNGETYDDAEDVVTRVRTMSSSSKPSQLHDSCKARCLP